MLGVFDSFKADKIISQIIASGDTSSPSSQQKIQKLKGIAKSSIPKIMERLNTTSLEESELVIDLLSKLVDRPTLQIFYKGLAHQDSKVVSGIVKVLGKAHHIDPNKLLELFDDPEVSKPAILQVLSDHQEFLNGEMLLRYAFKLEHNDQSVLFRILNEVADEKLIPSLISRADAKDPIMRARLAEVLSKFQVPQAQAALQKMLNDTSKSVRLAALEGLSKMDASVDIEQLCKLITDPDMKIQNKAIDAIVKLNHPDTVKYLIEPLRAEEEHPRRAAVEVLNGIANPNAVKDLLFAIKDSDWWVRSRAADALGKIGGKRVVDSVIELIKDDDEFVRRTAIEIINATKDQRTYDALTDALNDSDWWVRERAIDGLAALGDKRASPVLVKMLQQDDASNTIAGVLMRAFIELDAKSAIKPIIAYLDKANESVKKEAIQALGSLADQTHANLVKGAIDKYTKDTESEIQEVANSVIRKVEALESTASGVRERIAGVAPGSAAANAGAAPVKGEFDDFDPARMKPGDVLAGRYRFIKMVGRGAFGAVYLMEDNMVNEELIIKFLNPSVASDESIIKRFIYELRFARKVTHKNVIRIYDMLRFGESSAISMEYFPSHTLGGEIRGGKAMQVEKALAILKDICAGMDAAHSASVVHRDLKPSNILINDAGLVKVVDFGVASATQQMDTKLTKTGLLVGTPTYMAPEQVLGKKIDHRTDIYSLGVIMYEMLTGKPPYSGGDSMAIMYQHVQGKATPAIEINSEIPATLSAMIMKAMAVDPEKRFQTMKELGDRLAAFLA